MKWRIVAQSCVPPADPGGPKAYCYVCTVNSLLLAAQKRQDVPPRNKYVALCTINFFN